jgi:hypothetical protein
MPLPVPYTHRFLDGSAKGGISSHWRSFPTNISPPDGDLGPLIRSPIRPCVHLSMRPSSLRPSPPKYRPWNTVHATHHSSLITHHFPAVHPFSPPMTCNDRFPAGLERGGENCSLSPVPCHYAAPNGGSGRPGIKFET